MPVCLVKSLSSSTRAFAGSHAAQHIVSDLPSACADGAAPSASASVPAAHAKDRLVPLILIGSLLLVSAGRCRPILNTQARVAQKRPDFCLVLHGLLSMSTEF